MTDNHQQTQSPSYQLPALDQEFILGDSMRGVRFLLEYAKAEELLRAWGVETTIVVFGSARALPGGSDDESASTAPLPPGATPRAGRKAAWWYEQARRFGRIASERGGALTAISGRRYNVIATGGGPGLMEAANRGAHDAGAPSIGFNVRLPREQEPNAYSTPDLTFQFHYFAMRKMHLAMRARALVVFPGGFGTFDELFEVLTLVQTHKAPRIPILCFDRSYWTRVVNFDALVEEEMISPSDLDLFCFADDAEEAWAELIRSGLELPSVRTPAPGG
ncbi:MAG: TIGR00730 family Rossman fold protein [Variibacter sp.]|nr:TIGR00730 family Rossman fold protein [Variibacter sp.]